MSISTDSTVSTVSTSSSSSSDAAASEPTPKGLNHPASAPGGYSSGDPALHLPLSQAKDTQLEPVDAKRGDGSGSGSKGSSVPIGTISTPAAAAVAASWAEGAAAERSRSKAKEESVSLVPQLGRPLPLPVSAPIFKAEAKNAPKRAESEEDEGKALRAALGLSSTTSAAPHPPLRFGAMPLVYEVHLEVDTETNSYGFTPLVSGSDGAVLIGELNMSEPDGRANGGGGMLPAESAGIGLLDQLLTVNGRAVRCYHEQDVRPLFTYPSVTLRLRSSYKQSLVFTCPSCANPAAITSSDLLRVREEACGALKQSSLVCDACDARVTVLAADVDDLEHAALAHAVK